MRELVYLWLTGSLFVLVPKKRGDGFLKCPLGHQYSEEAELIATIANCDVFGLDGHLSFECGTKISTYHEERDKFIKRIMPALEKYILADQGRN